MRRLHRDDRENLKQVVLDHVAQCADAVIELAASFHAEFFRDGDLHALDPFASPDRFEQRVAEAQSEQVLHRLLAEIVIDPVDLLLVERSVDETVERPRTLEIVAERLLEHDPPPAAVGTRHLGGAQSANDVGNRLRRRGQVIEGIALRLPREEWGADVLRETRILLRLRRHHPEIAETSLEPGPEIAQPWIGLEARVLLHSLVQPRSKGYVGHLASPDTNNLCRLAESSRAGEAVKSGRELPLRQVTGSAEDDDCRGR